MNKKEFVIHPKKSDKLVKRAVNTEAMKIRRRIEEIEEQTALKEPLER